MILATVTFPTSTSGGYSTNTFSLSLSVSKSNQPLHVPGYLKMKVDSDFKIIKQLGSGGASILYFGLLFQKDRISKSGDIPIAVKEIVVDTNRSFQFEIAILK